MRIRSFVVIVAVCTYAPHAWAQEGFAIDRHQPTAVGDRFFAVPGGGTTGHLMPRASVSVDWAHQPLLLEQRCVEGCDEDGSAEVVSDQVLLHVGASLALWDRLLLSLSMPIAVASGGDDPALASGATLTSPHGAAAGDLRPGVRVRLFGETRDPLQLALGGYLWVPTGDESAYAGSGGVRGMPHVSAGGYVGNGTGFAWAAQVGTLVRESGDFMGVDQGTEITFGGAAGLVLLDERLQLGAELDGATVVASGEPFRAATTHAELLFGARARLADVIVIGAGAGPGLTAAAGTPSARVLGQLAYAPLGEAEDGDGDGIVDPDDACARTPGVPDPDPRKHGCPPDRDEDGVVDAEDACPLVVGVQHRDPKKNGCPPDRDDDGILDQEDACPEIAGVRQADRHKNGCPLDRDNDGIFDGDDACPTIAGVRSDDPLRHGCPPDRDGDAIHDGEDACPTIAGVRSDDPWKHGCPSDKDEDTIVDADDACPLEKGPADPDPLKNGCPTLVRVTKEQIHILQEPRFSFGKAEILQESAELLRQVAQVLAEHPEIVRVSIEGHTDKRGSRALNQRLSEQRAAAVRAWLVEREGVAPSRLDTRGFGPDQPIADNATNEGRAQNRRVEFRIVERTAPPREDAAEGGTP